MDELSVVELVLAYVCGFVTCATLVLCWAYREAKRRGTVMEEWRNAARDAAIATSGGVRDRGRKGPSKN